MEKTMKKKYFLKLKKKRFCRNQGNFNINFIFDLDDKKIKLFKSE